ncbi:MAG TPA: hypothetical protein VJU78_09820, partial [Chitinophagaceae bacterium]|nr:hypothetical protein [Chitinophagaceae bacterium]
MLSRKILFLAIVSSSIYNYASGQAQDARIPKVVPPSPNAAALQKYGDIPVSAYTGMPSISIPLYDIKSGDISFPISISYNASGVKVADEASRVGLSWVLNAGGVISRSVVGGDDFEFLTYSYNNQTIPEIPKVPRFDQGADFNMKDGCDVILNGYGIDYSLPSTIFTEGNYDLQPDQYSYNFNGHSGKFGLRRNRNAVLNTIEKIDIKVIGSDASSWEIKTPDGTLYKFEQFETYVESGGTSNHHKSSWYLTKIISATGRTVDFVYSSNSSYIHSIGSYFESKPGANIGSSTNGDSGPHNISMYAAAVPGKWYTNLYLTKILFDNGEVQFNYLADRLDISGDVRLTDIQIFSKKHGVAVNQLIKSWNFNYSYFEGTNFTGCFSNPNATTENLTKRLKLVSVQESNGSSSLPPYQFSYNNENDNPVLLPPKSWFGRDHWGYYNGKINTSLIPTHSNGCSNDPIAFYLGSMGNDRNANPQYNQLFVLNKIKYPTGGFTTFEYETNDFDNSNSVINDHSYFANYVGTIPATAEAGFSNIQAGGTFTAAL